MATKLQKLEDAVSQNGESVRAVQRVHKELSENYSPIDAEMLLEAFTTPTTIEYLRDNASSPEHIEDFLVPGRAIEWNDDLYDSLIPAFTQCITSESYVTSVLQRSIAAAAAFNAAFTYSNKREQIEGMFNAYDSKSFPTFFERHGAEGIDGLTDLITIDPELSVPFVQRMSMMPSEIGSAIIGELRNWYTLYGDERDAERQKTDVTHFIVALDGYKHRPEKLQRIFDTSERSKDGYIGVENLNEQMYASK